MAVVLVMETEYNHSGTVKIRNDEAKQAFNDILLSVPDFFSVVEMSPLSANGLEDLLCNYAFDYVDQKYDEILKMTQYGEEETAKIKKESDQQREYLLKKFSLENKELFTAVDEDVLDCVVELCNGNPLVCLNFIYNLLDKEVLKIQKKKLEPPKRQG
jgi:hypothetical protein